MCLVADPVTHENVMPAPACSHRYRLFASIFVAEVARCILLRYGSGRYFFLPRIE